MHTCAHASVGAYAVFMNICVCMCICVRECVYVCGVHVHMYTCVLRPEVQMSKSGTFLNHSHNIYQTMSLNQPGAH